MLYPGAIVMPDEIRKLSHVCATICDESGVALGSKGGQALAAHIFRLFMNGLTEELELLGAMRHRDGRNGGQRPHEKRPPRSAHTDQLRSPL